jgi:hypothetical protein
MVCLSVSETQDDHCVYSVIARGLHISSECHNMEKNVQCTCY